MSNLLAEFGPERLHQQRLEQLLRNTKGPVRIASAYVTDTALLFGSNGRKIQLLTSISPMDLVCGATSLSALRSHVGAGVECRRSSSAPRLHAKVYIFGNDVAIVTSANLTTKALNDNLEVGVELTGSHVRELSSWFDRVWSSARPLTLAQLSKWEKQTAALRRQYLALRSRVCEKTTLHKEPRISESSKKELRAALRAANQFFLCNTDRRYSATVEQLMRHKKYAAVWEDFRWRGHMDKVRSGDLIFMYAKGVGIIGVGRAKAKREILPRRHPDRIRNPREYDEPEWRVPVKDWLAWVDDDAEAFPCKIGNVSFIDVSGEKYRDLRDGVARHFLLG
jgi:hypothetical protein